MRCAYQSLFFDILVEVFLLLSHKKLSENLVGLCILAKKLPSYPNNTLFCDISRRPT